MWKQTKNGLHQKFEFKDFDEAFEFLQIVAGLSRRLNHHPKIVLDYNVVEFWLMTHSAEAITDKDHELAKLIEAAVPSAGESTETPSIEKAKLFTDGGSRGNPGPSALGYAILDMSDQIVKKEGIYLGITTNNQAEYRAIKAGLENALAIGVKYLDVYADSMLAINQINGTWKQKDQNLLPVFNEIKALLPLFGKVTFTHVPRAMNKIADGMVNECLDSQKVLY
jgi:ribonuclease HI